jgi:hypothetical protein
MMAVPTDTADQITTVATVLLLELHVDVANGSLSAVTKLSAAVPPRTPRLV